MLFEQFQPKDDSPIEELNITSIYLFYSDEQVRDFKRMAKLGMQRMWPTSYQQQNISDFIFELIKQYANGSNNAAQPKNNL